MVKRVNRGKLSERTATTKRRNLKEAESYGWVVNDWEAREAYDFACDYFGEEDLNSQIVRCLGNEELAKCLAFIFRMNEFDEWENRDSEDEDDIYDEGCHKKSRKKKLPRMK